MLLAMSLLGAHVSVAGGPHTAFGRGAELGCEALQIFVKNARGWRAKPLDPEEVARFRTAREEAPQPVIAHAGYLINPCATNPETLDRSCAALLDELERCAALGVDALVLHPGAHLGAGEDAGLEAVARSLDGVLARAPAGPRLLLENTAGQGTVLGARFGHLGRLLDLVDDPARIGVCIDSCHAFAAGYDLRDGDGYEAALEELEREVGLARLGAWHLNDSKFGLGENKDRHENVGEGALGLAFFERVVNDGRFAATPMLVETPTGDDDLGHARDLAKLKTLRR